MSAPSTPVLPIQPEPVSKKQISIALAASVLGFSLDLFDYSVLLYVAATVGPLIFPASNPTLSLAGVYAAYGTSAIVRPLGAALFGNYADRHGRKKALFVSVGGVGIITALMGAVPTVSKIGVLATVLFIMLRFLQGLFVGGVPASTHTIGTETVPPSWRGWASGLIGAGGSGVAQLLSAGVFLVMSLIFPGPAFTVWGWRCMFFCGLFASLLAVFVLYNLNESPLFVNIQKRKATVTKAPIRVLFSKQYRGIAFINMIVVFGAASMFYVAPGYLPTFLGVVNHLPRSIIAKILMWGGVGAIILPQIVGHLSQVFGRKKAFWGIGALAVAVFSFGYYALAGARSMTKIAALSLLMIWIGDIAIAPIMIFLNERFPTAIRATGTAFCWNVGFALGGLVPLAVSLLSPTIADIPSRLTWFALLASACLIVGPMFCQETRGRFE